MIYKNGVYIPPLDDIPVDGELEKGVTSNRGFDHEADTTTAHGAVSAATASKIVIRDALARAKFAAPAAAGDALIKGTRHLIAEMPTLTTGKAWKGVAGVPAEADWPTGGATIATGTYTGDGTGPRQITTGFKCSLVVLLDSTTTSEYWLVIPNRLLYTTSTNVVTYLQLHATDGFSVQAGGGSSAWGNVLNNVYYYWAISE